MRITVNQAILDLFTAKNIFIKRKVGDFINIIPDMKIDSYTWFNKPDERLCSMGVYVLYSQQFFTRGKNWSVLFDSGRDRSYG